MTPLRKLGVWIDHSRAQLTEYTIELLETKIIKSDFTHEDKEHTLSRSENVMHNKEQHHHLEFYKKIAEVIRNYDEVLLFGPTDAKVELFNILKADQRFSKIDVKVRQADKMTESQQQAFIREYFLKE